MPSTETKHAAATKKFFRGSSLLLVGRTLAIGVNFASQVLIVRLLAKSDYGAFAYALSVVALTVSFSNFGLDKALSCLAPSYQEKGDPARMAGVVFLVFGVIGGLSVCVALVVLGLFGLTAVGASVNPLSASLLGVMILLTPLDALDNAIEKSLAVFAGARALFFRRHLVAPLLKLAAVLSLLFFEGNVYALGVAYVAAGVLGTGFSIFLLLRVLRRQDLLRHFRWRSMRVPGKEVFAFGLPLLATDFALVLRTSFVVIVLEIVQGVLSVAAYRAVLPVARLNMVVMETFKSLFTPTAARLVAHNDKHGLSDLYWRNTTWLAVLTFPCFAVSFALAEPLAVALFGVRYADSGPILSLLSLGFYLNAAFGFNALTLRVCNKVRILMVNDLATSVVAVVLNLALIPFFGAVGGAAAVCASLVVQNVLHQLALVRTGAIQAPPGECLRAYATIALAGVGLLAAQWAFSPSLWIGLPLAVLAFAFVLAINYRALQIVATFPELLRFAPVRKLHAAFNS